MKKITAFIFTSHLFFIAGAQAANDSLIGIWVLDSAEISDTKSVKMYKCDGEDRIKFSKDGRYENKTSYGTFNNQTGYCMTNGRWEAKSEIKESVLGECTRKVKHTYKFVSLELKEENPYANPTKTVAETDPDIPVIPMVLIPPLKSRQPTQAIIVCEIFRCTDSTIVLSEIKKKKRFTYYYHKINP